MIRQLSLSTLLLFFFFGSLAQPYNYRFHNYSSDQIDAKVVYSIAEDAFGFIWIGTENGLRRFDGKTFKAYSAQTFLGQSIYDLKLDDQGNIWIAASNGAFLFDRVTEQIVRIWDTFEIVSEDATAIEFLNENVWIGTSEGLYRINLQDSSATLISKKTNKEVFGDDIFDILATEEGDIWASTLDGGLIRFDQAKGNFISYLSEGPNSISSNVLRDLGQTKEGELLIGTEGHGLNIFDKETQTFRQYAIDLENYDYASSSAYSILRDHLGRIWLGTWANGLILINEQKKETHRFINDAFDESSIGGNFIITSFQSSSGDLWFGSYESGLVRLSLEEQKIVRFTQHNQAGQMQTSITRSVYEDTNGIVWIGTGQGGLYRYDPLTGKMEGWLKSDGSRDGMAKGTIWSISESADGSSLWFGTSRGIGKLNKNSYQIDFITPDDSDNSLVGSNVLKVLDDKNGSLWVGTWYGGLNRLDLATGQWEFYGFSANDPSSLASNNVNDILIDSKGRVWVATDESVSRFLGKEKGFTNYPVYGLMLAEDKKGNILIGDGDSGLFYFDDRTNQVVPWPHNQKLNALDVYSILVDDDNKYWLHSSNGVDIYDPVANEVQHLAILDGISGTSSIARAAFQGPTGLKYFGAREGLSVLDPDDLPIRKQPRLLFTDLLLLNQSVGVSDSTVLSMNIENTDLLTLSYKDYIFALEFSALDYQHGEEIRYSYRLDGFDQNWIRTSSESRKAVYTNVPPGEYTFLVKAEDKYSSWEPIETQINIRIIPPWWQTKWAIAAFIFAFGMTIYLFINARVSRVKRQKTILEKEVKNRTSEIANQKDALEEQARTLGEMNSQKNRLIGIISHDIRNPLASMKSILELLDPSILTSEQLEDIRNQMGRQLEGLTESIITLLDWAKSQMDGEEMKVEAFDLRALSLEMEKLYEVSLEKKGVSLVNSVDMGNLVSADANQIRAVLRNLISNAIKFSSSGDSIHMEIKESTNEFVTVAIRDTGRGMTEAKVKDLFSNQVVSTRGTSGEKGIGLGLILVKDFVEKNKGVVWVESQPHKGSTFYFTIPTP